ncbi:cysteine rich repeat-containing protein [Geobacter sp. SVR]|uniref:cysteine rich repeat-containing protein n=1 Tax=Geobacter sp. SVR TaxID=2495594 RepID=UPI00143F0414|nr:cysteine rich repeat-containing protein [Geobacter sp. SVR]BCS53626.1 hypothetical protein GSVR_19340 [Geobacter sp. SVR]GCF84177.1 hypothetical protein GSbR_07770 [Geobacter sp. SVR]
MKVKYVLSLAAPLTIFFATAALAAQGPCAEDINKLCKDVTPGSGKVLACLKANEASVSSACKEHLGEMKQKLKAVQKACHDDVEQFCSEVKPGKGAIAKCLKEHSDQVSVVCKETIAKNKEKQ